MARPKKVTISKKVKRAARRGNFEIDNRGIVQKNDTSSEKSTQDIESTDKGEIKIPQVVPVRKLGELLGEPVSAVISKLFASGVQATINESVDFDTAAIIADEFGYAAEKESQEDTLTNKKVDKKKHKRIPRPPVIAVMGHVDHGKTTLLDAIRQTNVVAGESGGITQHIGAYQVEISQSDTTKNSGSKNNKTERKTSKTKPKGTKQKLTFLDTPGHEAFSAMRAHGANVTDVIILVVAADDGVKPQTLEAISHARSANVPLVVAINKIDAPGADAERVKRELADHNLVPEEWSGKTPMVPVSAKKDENIDGLLEVVSLTADLEELFTTPTLPGTGVVIESKVKPGLGAVATILVQNGTLELGGHIIIGSQAGKIKTMENDSGQKIKKATASMPVQISGFKTVPQVGEIITSVENEKSAKDTIVNQQKSGNVKSIVSSGLGEVSQAIKKGNANELKLILRADVQGSEEAIKTSLDDIKTDDVTVKFVSSGIGEVNESDVNLAVSSGAIIIAFNVGIPPAVKKLADVQGVKISRYKVIYELIDEVKAALQGLLKPEIIETNVGKFKVIKIFRRTQTDGIIGGLVTKGNLRPGLKFRAYRGDDNIGDGTIKSVQIGPDNVDIAKQNDECGLNYEGAFKFKPDDTIEAYQLEEVLKTIK